MKQLVAPGKSLEIPTVEEIGGVVSQKLRASQSDVRLLRTSGNFKTDGAGLGFLDELYVAPQGYEARIYRWIVANVDGSSPGARFQSAAGWIELQADEQRIDWIPLAAPGGIPDKLTWSTNQGPVIANGQRLSVFISGGPVSTNIEVRIQGILLKADSGRYL